MTTTLSEQTIDALLDKLGSDDDFRAAFQANPRAATRTLGTNDPAVEALPESPIRTLAGKGEFSRTRHAMKRNLLATREPFTPITLDIPQ